MIHTGHIRQSLKTAMLEPGQLVTMDTFYRCPTLDWVKGPFRDGWLTFINGLGVQYNAERWDCDDYARMCAAYAQLLNGNTPKADKCGLAFGVFAFVRGLDYGHVINVFMVQEPGSQGVITPHFFEPQPTACGLVDLTNDDGDIVCVAATF